MMDSEKEIEKKPFTFKGMSRRFSIILVSVCLIFLIILTLGIIIYNHDDDEVVEVNEFGGNVRLVFTTETNDIMITKASPVTDEIGIKSPYSFDFSVETDLKKASRIEYELSVEKDDDYSTIADSDIKIYLEKEDSGTYTRFYGPSAFKPLSNDSSLGSKKGDMVIASVKKIKSGVDNYRLRIWLSDKSKLISGDYLLRINIKGKAK